MLKRRLIPKLQIRRVQTGSTQRLALVTTINFDRYIEIGDPVSQAKVYEAQAADELIFLDLDATLEGRDTHDAVVKRAAEEIFMPFTVGGGVRSVDDFRRLLRSGADKVSVNTAAVEDPELIARAADVFGSQCVVLSIDVARDPSGRGTVRIRGGRTDTGLDPLEWAERGVSLGAGEILLTSIDRDGTRQGLDITLCARIAGGVGVPLIVSGGCGLAEHFVQGFAEGKASAVAAGTYFCFKDENPMQTRSRIRNAGIPIRMHT